MKNMFNEKHCKHRMKNIIFKHVLVMFILMYIMLPTTVVPVVSDHCTALCTVQKSGQTVQPCCGCDVKCQTLKRSTADAITLHHYYSVEQCTTVYNSVQHVKDVPVQNLADRGYYHLGYTEV